MKQDKVHVPQGLWKGPKRLPCITDSPLCSLGRMANNALEAADFKTWAAHNGSRRNGSAVAHARARALPCDAARERAGAQKRG